MEEKQRSVAKRQMVALIHAGHSWQEAAAATGIHLCRSTIYRLLREIQTRGDAVWCDGRHGHPAKLQEAVLQWLRAFCRAAPQTPSRAVQAALQEQFGIHVSVGHLNRVRAQLGIGNHVGRLKKNCKRHILRRKPSGKKELADSFLSPLRKKQVYCQR